MFFSNHTLFKLSKTIEEILCPGNVESGIPYTCQLVPSNFVRRLLNPPQKLDSLSTFIVLKELVGIFELLVLYTVQAELSILSIPDS